MAPSTGAACPGSTAAACLPHCSTRSAEAAWAVRPEGKWTSTQRYLPRTNILETTFRTPDDGIVSVTDFMPVAEDGQPSGEHPEIHRRLRCSRGRVTMSMIFMPRFEYGARATRLESAASRSFRHRPHRPGAHSVQREAVRVDDRGSRPPRPGSSWKRERSAGWSFATTTMISIQSIVTRAPASSTTPPNSGRSGRRRYATRGRTGAW